MKSFLLLLFVLIITNRCFSQEEIQFYSNLQIGDKLKVLGDEPADLSIYFFLNESNCATCMPIIKDIYLKYSTKGKIQNIIFFNAEDESKMSIFRSSYPEYKYVLDSYGVYKNLYKIKNYPFIIILNNDGELLFQACPISKKTFDTSKLPEISTSQNKEHSSNLKLIEEKYLYDKNDSCSNFIIADYQYLKNEGCVQNSV